MPNWFSDLYPEAASFLERLEFGREQRGLWLVAFVGLVLLAGWLYSRDTAELNWFWKVWLGGLRLLTLAGLLVIALDPERRDYRDETVRSRVLLLSDTSASMGIADQTESGRISPKRIEQVQTFLEKSPLLAELRKVHDVHVYTFDSRATPRGKLPQGSDKPKPGADTTAPAEKPIDWDAVLQASGPETRLGETLMEIVRQEGGEKDSTLAGVVVITDGGNNAGIDPAAAADAARTARIRLFPVGVGSTAKPINLQLVDLQGPTHVHIGDGFSLSAVVAGQGMTRKPLIVEMSSRKEDVEKEFTVLQEKEVELAEDGVPITVSFDYTPTEPGKRTFRVRVKAKRQVTELIEEDNVDELTVTVVERKTKVLMVAGGPMRDYQLVRNLMHRDNSVELDVWLQTGVPGISQESDNLLFSFPDTREELFKYDVIILFDPNWDLIEGETKPNDKGQPENGNQRLAEWVFAHAGGLIYIAGDVYTPELAGVAPDRREAKAKVFELLPVVLDTSFFADEDLSQPWPIEFTREGLEAGFLQLVDGPGGALTGWQDFPGVFRCYPTKNAKAGATVYARFDNADSSNPPILLASQFYGAGRVLYLGSPEMWRLRAVEEDYYDRLWIRMLREVGQGRLLRGSNRAVLLLDRKQYPVGSTVQVRARVLDPQFREYVAERLPLDVQLPNGRALSPALELAPDKNRPGQYTAQFVAGISGTYSLKLPIPESVDAITDSFSVKQPNLEYDHPEQNDTLLKLIARNADRGKYFTLDTAAKELPKELDNRTRQKRTYERPERLWDREWVIYFLVGVLGLEWLTRKLLRLA